MINITSSYGFNEIFWNSFTRKYLDKNNIYKIAKKAFRYDTKIKETGKLELEDMKFFLTLPANIVCAKKFAGIFVG